MHNFQLATLATPIQCNLGFDKGFMKIWHVQKGGAKNFRHTVRGGKEFLAHREGRASDF